MTSRPCAILEVMSEFEHINVGLPVNELAFSVSFRSSQSSAPSTTRAVLLSRSGLLYQSAEAPVESSPFPPPAHGQPFAQWGRTTTKALLREARYNPSECYDIYAINDVPKTSRKSPLKSSYLYSAPPATITRLSRNRSIDGVKENLSFEGLPTVRPSYSPQFKAGCAYAERPESRTLVSMIDSRGVAQGSDNSSWAKTPSEAWEDFVNHVCRARDHWQSLVHLPPLGDSHHVFSFGNLLQITSVINDSGYLPLYVDGVLDAIARADMVLAVRVSRRESDGKEVATYILNCNRRFSAGGFDWRGSNGANATALTIEHGDEGGAVLSFVRIDMDVDDTLYLRRSSRWEVVDGTIVYRSNSKRPLEIARIPPNVVVSLNDHAQT